MYKLSMIGCGKLGKPTSELFQSLGHDVLTYDTAFKNSPTLKEAVQNRDLIFIAVPTPHEKAYDGSNPISHLEPKNFDYSILKKVVEEIDSLVTNTPIVIISTVLPGTVRALFETCRNEIIYNPYLISMGAVAYDLQNPDIIIMGTKDGNPNYATNLLHVIYANMVKKELDAENKIHLGTWEEAESIKIFYNTFISTKLGLVNMIQDVAQRIGNMDVDIVTTALQNSSLRITGPKYMTAGMGDGGPCHPRDNIALRWLAQELDLGYDIFSTIVNVREKQAENLAKFLVEQAKENNLDMIFIHGKSFKPGVPYCDGSYSLLVGSYVKQITGKDPIYLDPLAEHIYSSNVKGVVLLAHNRSVTYDYMDHVPDSFYGILASGSVIVDPWRRFKTNDKSIKVIYYGNTRRNT